MIVELYPEALEEFDRRFLGERTIGKVFYKKWIQIHIEPAGIERVPDIQFSDYAKMYDGRDLALNWTGTKCCAEPEDGAENYNDENGFGACYQGYTIWNGDIPSGLPELTSINGKLTGCNIASPNKQGNEYLLNAIDHHTGRRGRKRPKLCV